MEIVGPLQTPHQRLVITAIREEAPQVKTFFLEAEDRQDIPYQSGQFLTFLFHRLGKEERRSYSMSSSSLPGDPLAITVKRVANGAHSRWLIDAARVGDVLRTTGASGLFTLPADIQRYKQIFLFGAGIGITPLYALLKTILKEHEGIQVVLVYSNRSTADTVFYNELNNLQETYGLRLQIEWLFSQSKHLLRARLGKWLFPVLFRQYLQAAPGEVLCYICGPTAYRWMTALSLEEAGIPSENIRKEAFINDRPAMVVLPPDRQQHTVTIRFKEHTYTLPVQYPDTILSAAKKAQIPLPYSCEAGRCATCIAHCTNGNVWMSYNEVLTEADLAKGLVLTCTGYPIGGNVTLHF